MKAVGVRGQTRAKPDDLNPLLYGAILSVLVLTPWPLGSRVPWAAMTAAALMIVTGAAWLIRRVWQGVPMRASSLCLSIVAFLGWIGLQWLFEWTVYPHGTAYDGALLLSYAATFAVSADLARRRATGRGLFTTIIVLGIAIGIFGLLQYLTWNGRLFWLFDPPYGGIPFGPFNNRNYFAGYMIVTLPVAVTALLMGTVRRGRALVLYGTWLALLALIICLSRGGFIALSAAVVMAFVLRPREPSDSAAVSSRARSGSVPRSRLASPYLAIAGVILVLVGIVLLQQADRVITRLETLLHFQSEESFVQRATFWRDALRMIADRPVTGFGLGSYVWVFPGYQRNSTSVVQTNAHNEYLEIAAETGLVGAAICAVFLLSLFRHATIRRRHTTDREEWAIRSGALSAWVGFCVYAAVDFPTVIPAINYVLAILAALAVADIGSSERTRYHRQAPPVATRGIRPGEPLEAHP